MGREAIWCQADTDATFWMVAKVAKAMGGRQWQFLASALRSDRNRNLEPPARAGIHHVAQTVAEEVEGENGQENGDAGEGGEPPGLAQVLAAVGDHHAPVRCRRLGAETDEAERGRR